MASISCSQIARPVALRWLYLDDVRTVDGEQHSAVRRGYALPKADNTQAAIGRFVRRQQTLFDCHLFSRRHDNRWQRLGQEKRMAIGESRIDAHPRRTHAL